MERRCVPRALPRAIHASLRSPPPTPRIQPATASGVLAAHHHPHTGADTHTWHTSLNTLGYSSVVHGAARATFLFIRPPSPRRARHAVPRPRLRLARGERFTVTLRAPPSAGLMLRCPPWPSLPRAARPEKHLICAPALPGASRHLHLPPATTPRLELVEGTVRQRLTGSADAGSAAGASIVRLSLSKLKRPNRWF